MLGISAGNKKPAAAEAGRATGSAVEVRQDRPFLSLFLLNLKLYLEEKYERPFKRSFAPYSNVRIDHSRERASTTAISSIIAAAGSSSAACRPQTALIEPAIRAPIGPPPPRLS